MRPELPATAPPSSAPTPADPTVQRFIAAQRIHSLYPRNNPYVRSAIAKLREAVQSFPAGETLRLEVDREHIRFADIAVLPNQAEVRELASRLYLAHVESIAFEPELTDDEIASFLDVLRLKNEDRGPLDEELPARGISRIHVRETGKVRIVETEEELEPGSWNILKIAELGELDRRLTDVAGRAELKTVLRTVARGQDLKASRIVGLLERPPEFASFLVELVSRLRPHQRIYLNAQIVFLQALLNQMEPLVEQLPEVDQMHLFGRLDEVIALLLGGLHENLVTLPKGTYVRLGELGRLFPETIREMTLEEALKPGLRPSPGLGPVLLALLRRVAGGEETVATLVEDSTALPAPLEEATLAAYRMAVLPAGGEARVPPAHLLSPLPSDGWSADEQALAAALTASNGIFDSVPTLVDLMAGETDSAVVRALLDQLADRFALALMVRNVDMAALALGALHAQRSLAAEDPALQAEVDTAIDRCGELGCMQAYAGLLAEALSGSEEQQRAADLLQGLNRNAMAALLEVLAAEKVQSTRRKLLDVLATIARAHLDVLAGSISHPEWFVVRNVVWILGRAGPGAVPHIRKVSAHREPRVRREAVRSLALIGGPEAIKGLAGYLYDRDEGVFREAVAKLAATRAPDAAGALRAVAQGSAFAEREAESLVTFARSLVALGGEESAELLERLAETKSSRGGLKAPEVRKALRDAAASIHAAGGRA